MIHQNKKPDRYALSGTNLQKSAVPPTIEGYSLHFITVTVCAVGIYSGRSPFSPPSEVHSSRHRSRHSTVGGSLKATAS